MRKRQQMLLAGRANCDQRRLAWWVASLARAIRGSFIRALLLSFAGHLETITKRIKLLCLPIGTCWSDPRQFYVISGEWWRRMADVSPMKHPQQPGVKRDGSICGGAFWFMWGKAVAKNWNVWDQVKTFLASVTNIPESINFSFHVPGILTGHSPNLGYIQKLSILLTAPMPRPSQITRDIY